MKFILVLTLSLFLANTSFSRCTWSGITVFPTTSSITSNSWIIIEGYASSQPIIDSLNKGYRVYLESGNSKIPLEVKELHKGTFRLTQAILVPTKKLTIGKTYYLKIDNLSEEENNDLTKWNPNTRQHEPISWRITDETDALSPELLELPELIDKAYTRYGCGPAIHTLFKISTKDKSDILVKTQLIDLKSGEETTYILTLDDSNQLSVGHGMCSGAFSYRNEGKYKIRFCLFDSNGNSYNIWSNWIIFDSPKPEIDSNF
jgi:hypothetical protein